MQPTKPSRALAFLLAALSTAFLKGQPARKLTTPKEALGFNVGDDYQMANYTQLEACWKKLASESERVKLGWAVNAHSPLPTESGERG